MSIIYATSPRTGKTYSVSIAGSSPTQAEDAEIRSYIDQVEGFGVAPTAAPETSETGNLIDFGKGAISGFARGFADIPGGIASLAAAGLSYIPGDQGEEEIEAFGQGITDAARSGIDYVMGPLDDNVASKSGQAVGSLASFLVPFAGGAKVASLAGAGVKATRLTGQVSAGTMGVALGAQNQVDRIARVLEEGGEVDNRELSILMGGGIGATEALPIGYVFGSIANILKKVPKQAKASAIKNIRQRLKSAGVSGVAEGGQEVAAAWFQDLVEKNMYKPDIEISASAYSDDAIYGGGAGATFNFLLETIAGRRIKKVVNAREQLLRDQQEEGAEVVGNVARAEASMAGPAGVDTPLLPAPRLQLTDQRVPEETATEEDVQESTVGYLGAIDSVKQQAALQNRTDETQALGAAARQSQLGGLSIELESLPSGLAQRISNSRLRAGSDIDQSAPTSLREIEAVLPDGPEKDKILKDLELREKPDIVQPKTVEEAEAEKKVTDNLSLARVAVETGRVTNKDGTISRPKLQRELKIGAVEAQSLIDKLARQGELNPVGRNKKDEVVYQPIQPEKTLEEAVPNEAEQRVQEFESTLAELRVQQAQEQRVLEDMKRRSTATQQEQLELEAQQRRVDDLNGRVNLQQNGLRNAQAAVGPKPKPQVQLRANEARSAVSEADQAVPTDNHRRRLNTIANSLRKYLAGIGLADVDLTTTNVIDVGVEIDPVTGKEMPFLVEGEETKGVDGRRIITLAMEIYAPNLSDAELEQRLAGVLNHEIIHSMKALGLFTDAEYQSLVKAAESRKYTKRTGGRNIQRDYTFLDRAEFMYPDLDPEGQQEEAIAEMFRAYTDGRLKIAGRPKSLFRRMAQFIKRIFGGYNEAGFKNVDELFSGITSGQVGRRQRSENEYTPYEDDSARKSSRVFARENSVVAYKVVIEGQEDKLFPLFVDAKRELPMNEWMEANMPMTIEHNGRLYVPSRGPIGKDGKEKKGTGDSIPIPNDAVKQQLFDEGYIKTLKATTVKVVAARPGLHAGSNPVANHIGSEPKITERQKQILIENGFERSITSKKSGVITLNVRDDDQVWVEILVPKNVHGTDWQQVADSKAGVYANNKQNRDLGRVGQIKPQEAQINDQIPYGGHYLYRQGQASAEESWVITGNMLITKKLSRDEVNAINAQQGIKDSPTLNELSEIFGEAEAKSIVTGQPVSDFEIVGRPDVKRSRVKAPNNFTSRVEGLNTLKDFISKNPDGFTVSTSMEPVEGGIAVAPVKSAEIITGKDLPIEIVEEYIENAKIVSSILEKEVFLGGWFNSEDGQYYLDNVLLLGDKQEALYIAQAAEQEAIFDLNTFEETRTENGIKELQETGSYRSDIADRYKRSIEEASEAFRRSRLQRQKQREDEASLEEAQTSKQSRRILRIDVPNVDSRDVDRISQRLPTADNATEDGIANNLSMEISDLNERQKATAANLIRSYNIITEEEAANATDDQIIEILTDRLADNLLFVYDRVDPQTRQRSKLWYIGANRIANEIAQKYGLEVRQVAAVMAALSPQKDWYKNVSQAERLIDIKMTKMDFVPTQEMRDTADRIYSQARHKWALDIIFDQERGQPLSSYRNYPKLEAYFIRIYDETYNDQGYQIVSPDGIDLGFVRKDDGSKEKHSWGSNLEFEKSIISIDNPDQIAITMGNRHKVRNFYNNIIAPNSMDGDITSDTHAVAAAHLKPLSGSSTEVSHNFGTTPDTKKGTKPLPPDWNGSMSGSKVNGIFGSYVIYAVAHRRAAEKRGVLPREMQSITWEAVRGLFLPSFKRNANNVQKINGIWNNYRKGLISINEARQEVLDEAGEEGRFRPPDWEGSDRGSLRSPELAINEGELSGAIVSRRNPRDYGGVGSRVAGGNTTRTVEPNIGNLTERETEQIGKVGEVIETLPKYSRRRVTPPPEILGFEQQAEGITTGIPVKNRFATVSAPVRFPDKNLQRFESLFGIIKDGDRNAPVILFAGEHNNETKGGYGISHILARGHEQELIENSKFKNIESAIQQTFFAWHKQGFQDGPNVISEVVARGSDRVRPVDGSFRPISKKDMNLVWLNPSHNSLPFRVVLNYGLVSEPAVKEEFGFTRDIPVYSITTAYPLMNVKQRAEIKRSRSVVRIPVNFNPPSTKSIDSIVADNEEAYQRLTYNNVSKILAPVARKFWDANDNAEARLARTERFITKFQDAMLPVGKMVDELKADGFTVTEGLDPYMREERSHGIIGFKLEQNTQNLFEPLRDTIGDIDISEAKIKELTGGTTPKSYFLVDAIKASGEKLAIADAYVYALHAKERNEYVQNKYGRGLGSGMSNTEADAIINWVNSLDLQNQQLLNGVRDYVKQIVASTNAARRDGGLMAEEYQFENYVPLRGDLDPESEIAEDGAGLARTYRRKQPDLYGGRRRQDPRIAAGRGTSYAEDMIGTVMMQNQTSIVNGERNKVGQTLLNMLDPTLANPNADASLVEAAKKLDMKGIAEIVTDVPDRIKDNVLSVKVNGEQDPIKIFIYDDRIARAMKGAYGDGINRGGAVVRYLTTLNRYLSSINTTYNPEFMVTNFARDLETALVNIGQYDGKGLTKEILKGAMPAVAGIGKHIRARRGGEPYDQDNYWSQKYQEFMEDGGKNATNQIDTVKDQVNNIRDILGDISGNTMAGKFGLARTQFLGKGVRSILGMLDDANTAVENGVRVATYDALLKRGFSRARAAQAARNITVNFAKAGEERAIANALYLFYNASVQGSFALYNAMIRSPRVRKIWGGMILYGILQDQLLAALSGDEDEDGIPDYDELSDYTLEHNLMLNTFGLSDDKYIKIPLGYGINSAVNLGRALSRTQRGEYTVGQASNSIFGTLLESISPIGGVNDFDEVGDYAIVASPTVFEPATSLFVNRDFDGSPIFKEGSQFGLQKPASQRHWTTTSGISKTISRTINDLTGGSDVTPGVANVSPDIIDYIFGFYTGAAGKFVQRTAEAPLKVVDALKGDYEGDIIREIPFLRKVGVNPSAFEDVGTFIENRDKVLYAGKELQYARQRGDVEGEARIRQKFAKELSIYGQLKAMNNARNQLLRQRKQIENNPRIPDSQKEPLIKRYREKINLIVKKANALLRDAGIK